MTLALNISKQSFKFSAAHFLIIDEILAEKLHGHNYQVQVQMFFKPKSFEAKGYAVHFGVIKRQIQMLLDQWDEHVLLPKFHPEMKFKYQGSSLQIWFRERYYVFPANEVILLPVYNTSVENYSKLLAHQLHIIWQSSFELDLFETFKGFKVLVQELPGQSASYFINLSY